MKCPDKSCGFRTKDQIKFCPECGTKLISEGELVVICSGRTEEGMPCNAEINLSQKFCINCGQKVDPQLLLITNDKCTRCGEIFRGMEAFCGECGLKRKPKLIPYENVQTEREIESNCNSPSSKMEGVEETTDENVKAESDNPYGISQALTENLASHHVKSVGPDTRRADNTNFNQESEIESNCNSPSSKMEGVEETTDENVKAESDNPNDISQSLTENLASHPVKSVGPDTRRADNTNFNQGVQETAYIDHSGDNCREYEISQTIGQNAIDDNDKSSGDKKVVIPADSPEHIRSGNITIIDETLLLASTGNIKLIDETSGVPSLLSTVDALKINDNSNSSHNSGMENTENFDDNNSTVSSSKRKSKTKEDLSKRLRTDSSTSDKDKDLTNAIEIESTSSKYENVPDKDSGKKDKDTTTFGTGHFLETNPQRNDVENNASKLNINMNKNQDEPSDLQNGKVKVKQDTLEEPIAAKSNLVFGEARGWDTFNETPAAGNSPTSQLFSIASPKQIKSEPEVDERNASNPNEKRSPTENDEDTNQPSESDDDDGEMKMKPNEDSEQIKDTEKEGEDLKQLKSKRKKQKQKEKNEKQIEERKKKNPKRTGTVQIAAETTTNDSFQQSSAQTTTNQEKSKVSNNSRRKPGRYITVIFHVLISPEFKFNPEEQKALIKIGDEIIGGKWKKDFELEICQRFEDDVFEMKYQLDIHQDKITLGRGISYKYCLKGKKKDKDEYKYEWEGYMKGGKTGEGADRGLFIPYKWRDQDVWHQYDGFIEKSNKGMVVEFIKSLNPWRKKEMSHFDFALETFIQDLVNTDTTNRLNDSFVQLEMLQHGLWNTYGMDGRQWNYEYEYKKDIGPKIINCVLDCIKINEIPEENETLKDKEQRIGSVISVILAFKRMGLVCDDQEKRQLICKLMVIKTRKDNGSCEEIELFDKLYRNSRKTVLEAIISLVRKIVGTSKDPCWMYLMPWIHILSETVAPFEKPSLDMQHDHVSAKWWGINDIGVENVNSFKRNSREWMIQVEHHIEELFPMFEIDYLLPRTIVAAVELSNLERVLKTKKIPFEVCLAVIIFYTKMHKPKVTYGRGYVYVEPEYESRNETMVADCVVFLQDYMSTAKVLKKDTEAKIMWEMRYKIALQLFRESSQANRYRLYCNCALIAMYSISIFVNLHNDESKKRKEAIDALNKAAVDIGCWMERWFWNWTMHMESILMVWNCTIAEGNASEDLKEKWNGFILNKLYDILINKVITTSVMMTDFVQLYCRKVDSFKPAMQDVLGKVAFKAIAKGYQLNYTTFLESERKHFGWLLSKLFLDEWGKAVSDRHEDQNKRILNHVIKWPPFLQYLKIYSEEDETKLKLLSEECTVSIVQAVSTIESRIDTLLDGSITVECLNLLDSNDSKFPEIAVMLKHQRNPSKHLVDTALQLRQKEIQAFKDQAELMTTLTSLCSQLSVDVSDVYVTLNKQKDLENHQVKEFCKPAEIHEGIILKDFQPTLSAFNVSAEVISILPELHTYNKSSTFISFWEGFCEAKDEEVETLDDVVTKIWYPAKQSCDNLAERIRNGSITFPSFEKMIGRIYREDSDSMEAELMRLKITEVVVKERLDQLFKYRQLGACVRGAKEILKFQRQFRLEGDFKQIQVIAEHDQQVMEMKSFDENVMKTCDVLKEVTAKETKCLDAFIECRQLVNWLKRSMEKSGLKELKVFVDLAFMSAGDEPMNISRVQCLHAAVTGYAPLIFDLKQTAGYKDLLEICSLVWKELETDEKLPQKLIDTNRHLEWLKDIKKAHGSVEVTSLVQSDAINASGIYTVGMKAFPKKAGEKDILDISSSIKLTVSEVEGKRQLRNYTYENLQDLQSRLMLVAGKAEKGTDSVDRFTSIFDSVTRLANVNIKLCAAGCILFKEWTARFLCDKRKPVCAVLEFGAGEGAPTLKTHRSEAEDLVDIVPKIANFMETCLKNWIDHIKQKRREYHHLNYFTIDQLVILQKELVKIGTEHQPTHWIYPLLSAVKRNCSQDDLVSSMRETQQQIDNDQEMRTEDEVEDAEEEPSEESNVNEKRAAFIKEILDAGYDEKLALKALNHVEPDQVTDGIVWCMNHEDMEDSDSDEGEDVKPAVMETGITSQENNPEKLFGGWSQSTTSIQSMISSNIQMLKETQGSSVDSLLDNLKSLWDEFLVSISSNIKDYLSLEHLGMILRKLAERETGRIFRKLPSSFIEGAPNLIICPSGDVLSTALSLYMLEKDQALPQPDEVLMCTQNTTIDEVDIFWRRAIFGGGKKIHCLVNADLLDFDVSDTAERYLEQYIQETNYSEDVRYRLVVICSSDNENRSRIVASLDKYRRQALPLKTQHLREYLAEKLQMQQPVNGVKPAAFVDFNKSTVRVVKSLRAGVGKTLYKSRRERDLQRLNGNRVKVGTVSIPLQEKKINLHYVISRLLEHTSKPGTTETRIFHVDVAHEVQHGVDYLLFNLLVLGSLTDKTGFVWRKSSTDLYLIETLPLMIHGNNHRRDEAHYVHQILNILPGMTCRSPQDSLDVYNNGDQSDYDSDQLFDQQQFESSIFQRPYQYLYRLDQRGDLKTVRPEIPEGTLQSCLQTLLRHCGVQDPSWAELHHFVWFLNTQLRDFERSDFVGVVAGEDLPGFAQFVLRFLIQMSRDFSTRSLKMSEESPGLRYEGERMEVTEEGEEENEEDNNLEQYQLRRTWESSPHPYLFFNSDHISFTFLGFYIDRATGNLIDQQTNQVLERGIMQQNLYDSLVRNFVPIQEKFDGLPRSEKIQKMCNVMGIDMPHDPDDTYELTTDNVKKIMAIFMRFRCDIPVIIMGETGCGKTRLVKFMCGLQTPAGIEDEIQNMILMKVHGGTTNADIIRKVREAEKIAEQNVRNVGPHMYTVLFFDEANTTESIGLIKEIMVDKSMEGQKLSLSENLKMVAACNPYREHSAELIKKLEQAGLGYHVDAEDTVDKFGRVPMRRLVYRVQPLPQSLLPLVWDFGQLNTRVEDLYIRQMVKRYIRDGRLPNLSNLVEVVSAILTASQDYMRAQKDECSFVSLRDVDRVLSMMSWFYEQSQDNRTLYYDMDRLLCSEEDDEEEEDEEEEEMHEAEENMDTGRVLDDITRSLVLSLGVCYHACLKTREEYREHIAKYFRAPCVLEGGADQIAEEINCCQYVFLKNVQLEKNIAKNMALKENVFMMVVCIESRIPLFLVGKPGSSKSLAKTIVSDAMQGNASRKQLFRELKQAQMVSFQCSPLATPDGIVGTFKQCAQFQKDKDLDTFVSIVVLDEVGLAEDSPRMPLKTLHPLLEDGCQGDEKPEPYKKVAFIGISNWALDPAKMNRGILVQREVPDQEELENSARGICSTEEKVLKRIEPLIKPMCVSYLQIFDSASKNMREFFGLRDFYSLVKMVYAFAEKSKQKPTWYEMLHAVKRNFGGLEEDKVDPVKFFKHNLAKKLAIDDVRKGNDPDCSPGGLIEACLFERNKNQGESRYLLLLTENYGSLAILQQQILSRQRDIKPITIFGSSFRSDQEYTQVCRNINKIKVCMETGNTVVLLNLENLYESLYDALNQYYVYFGGERYVDLGLGTHRVKCPVHKNFRLIVVAEKQTVYKKFPIPLINRLEKHFLNINTMLSKEQQQLAKKLEDWAKQFARQHDTRMFHRQTRSDTNKTKDVNLGDVFMGYHDDSCSAIILQTSTNSNNHNEMLKEGKALLLWVATPEAVIRLDKSALPVEEQRQCFDIYFHEQHHNSITDYLQQTLVVEKQQQLFVQVTTHSKLLATSHKNDISKVTNISLENIMLLDTLSSFDTEQQFSNKIQQHLQRPGIETTSLLIIQCDSGDVNANLVACARYCVMDEYQKVREELKAPVHVVFIVQLPNVAGGCYTGFQCGVWRSVHIDDLLSGDELPDIEVMQQNSVSNLIEGAVKGHAPMDTNENANIGDTSENMDWQDEDIVRTQDEAMEGIDSSGASTSADASKGPLDIHDVIIGFETAGKKSGGRSLNVKDLILSCTQGALSMLKDKSENSQRTTERVALVLTLFHGIQLRGYELFLQGMCCLIASLLKEKETKAYGAENWLRNEAAKPDNIRKAGTFRKSCVQILESKISPILAGIIAHLDTNQNLDILEANQLPWKQDMWLAILNQAEALQLKYSDLQSPKRQTDLQEVVVLTTGFEGQIFKASMPFSWLIKQKIEEILKTQMPDSENEGTATLEEKIYFYVGVFEETALGKVLVSYNNTGEDRNIAEEYLLDFVCMSYKALSKEEFELVCQSLRYLFGQMVQELEYDTVTQLLLCIHEAYRALAPRLSYFHTMNIVWPDCSAEIVKLKQARPDHIMFQEKEFTFSTLCLLIEHLSPTKIELDQAEGRSKWLKKVHTFRPVIEKVLRLGGEDPSIYGAHSFQSIQRARCLWTRVMVMKLFLEHVCAVESEDKITVKHCMPLWKVLDDSANLKEVKTMDAIEKFLKGCNKRAIKEFLGKQETCCYCDAELDGPPIVLPCEHLFCDECCQNILSMGENTCLKCGQPIPQDWKPERQKERLIEKQKLADYQKRCNSFFMDVVSQLCFYDNKPPNDAVIDKLLTYITVQTKGTVTVQGRTVTKEMTIFNTGLDPNPVFRSFLLQLLMRTSEEEVMQNLAKYLGQADILLQQTNSETKQEYIDLGMLVIQCLEDVLSQELNSTVELEQGLKFIKSATRNIFSDELSVGKLYGLAEARIGLAIAAKAIANIVQQHPPAHIDTNVRRLIEAAQTLCENGKTDLPRVYLVKYMCRRYGIDVYQAVCQSQIRYLMWIGIQTRNENQRVEISDRFVVCGDRYTNIRESLTKVILGEDIQHLDGTLQELRTSQSHINVMLSLALYREITCSALYPQQQRKVTDKIISLLQNYIQNSDQIKHKDIPLSCLQNSIGLPSCLHLEVKEGCDFRQQGVQCLITHFLMVLSQLSQDRTILQTLVDMYASPQMYANKYIPTMPQDDLEDVKEALLAARTNPAFNGENPVFYRCPNGHPYVIGDCGRPATVGTCKECGSTIGGEGYRLRPGNIQHQGNDETQTGHILGPAGTRGRGPRPERDMTPLYCACVRLTIHMAMYLGAATDKQAVQQIIVPPVQERDVPEYLWRHILEDLGDLQRGIGRSIDDTFVLLHAMIDHMMRKHDKDNTTREDIRGLSSKTGRKEWEKAFCAQYVQPIFTDADRILQYSNQKLVQDQRLGADPLLCLLYEIDTQQEQEDPNHLELIPSVWRYRSPITLEHLRQEFDAKKAMLDKRRKHLKVLDLFLKEEHYLRAIRCIPSILKLQRELFNKYQRKLDKAEASQITIGHIIRDKSAGEETSHLVEDFIIAWDICRDTLKQYLCPTELGGMLVQKVYCEKITENTPISILMPALKEEGLCAYAMLDFLMRKQNDFLDKYINETTKAKKSRYISTVQPMEVTSAHLISYYPQQDLLPIILANCQYSFEIGKGTKIEYDFRSLEHQIMDRFLFSKSKVDVGPVLKIDLMVYRTEFTNGEVFKKLEEKIPQESLGLAVKSQICSELKTLPDLCQSLYNLDITISFLKSVGGNPEDSLERFMVETLRMRQTVASQKASQFCQLKHVQSLWLLFAHEKSKKMAEQKEPLENIFESVGPEFHEDLPGDVKKVYKEFMNALSVDKLSELVSTLHEYILLRVAVRENRDTEDYVDTTGYKLRDWLGEYSDEKERQTLVAVLGDFPESILYKHSVNTWLASYRKLYRKQTGDKKF